MGRKIRNEIIGKKYGRLTCLAHVGNGIYLVECDCGKQLELLGSRFVPSDIHPEVLKQKSCGCLVREFGRFDADEARKRMSILGKSKRKQWTCDLCPSEHYAKGLCANHYKQEWKRNKIVRGASYEQNIIH